MQNKGFTLIELLVVIVIIGILATISVATFSGYFAKARDTERQTFTAAARTAMLAEQVGQSSADYRLGAATEANVETAIKAVLTKQGITIPSGTDAYVVLNSADVTTTAATSFGIVVCGEEEADTTFTAGPLAPAGTCASGTYTTGGAETDINLD